MKRILVIMAIMALVSTAASAEGMMFGVKGGLNLANVTGDLDGTEMKMAFGGGIWFEYAITEAFSIQPEVLFMLKGYDTEIDDTGFKATYIDIPILAKYSVPMEGSFVPFFYAGPYFGILMSADMEVLGTEIDWKDYTKTLDIGAVGGAGVNYMLGEGCLTLDARYAMGFTTLDDAETDPIDVKNTGIQFFLGYGFAF